MLEAAKMRVRTTTGWHGRRTVTEQRVLGGRLARLRHQSANGTQIAEVESELRALRERKKITRYKVEDLLDQAQYRWHTAMFTATEYLRTKRVLLPSRANRGLCDWLSFPEVGIRCTGGTIKSARRHFYIERRNGRSFRVYQYQIPRNIKGLTKPELENSAQLNDQVLLYRSFNCHRCGRQMVGKVTGLHLAQEEHIPIESIGLSLDPAEFYRTDNDETLASLTEDSL